MKKEIPQPVIIGAVVVILLIIGVVAYKVFFTNQDRSPNDPAVLKQSAEIHAQSYENWKKTVQNGGSNNANSGSRGAYSKTPGAGGN